MPSSDAFAAAIAQIAPLVEADPGTHTVMRGLEKIGGRYTGRECVVVLVKEKKPLSELQFALPHAVKVGNGQSEEVVRVDVQESPPFAIQILRVADGWVTYSATGHQSCFSPTVPGGAQISPAAANWVGTLGVPWRWQPTTDGREHFGFLTNRHVAGLTSPAGHRMRQPHAAAGDIGYLVTWADFRRNGDNYVDLALYDSRLKGKDFVRAGIYGLTNVDDAIVDLRLGDPVVKSGRTTGVTRGIVSGLDARTSVSYGEHGVLRFAGQVVIDGERGDMSSPGDSGSGIFLDLPGVRRSFGALLFAGGGGKTLANPAKRIQSAIGGRPFSAEG